VPRVVLIGCEKCAQHLLSGEASLQALHPTLPRRWFWLPAEQGLVIILDRHALIFRAANETGSHLGTVYTCMQRVGPVYDLQSDRPAMEQIVIKTSHKIRRRIRDGCEQLTRFQLLHTK